MVAQREEGGARAPCLRRATHACRRCPQPQCLQSSLPFVFLPLLQAAAARLVLGADCKAFDEKRVASCQTLSGTGALTVAAHAIRRLLPGRALYCSDPTWEDHNKIIADCGVSPNRGGR